MVTRAPRSAPPRRPRATPRPRVRVPAPGDPSRRYVNRELSWIEFNRRVLEEAVNRGNPPLERCRFLAIFESNLDEFYMVRVSGLIEQLVGGVVERSPDGLGARDQLAGIARAVAPLR